MLRVTATILLVALCGCGGEPVEERRSAAEQRGATRSQAHPEPQPVATAGVAKRLPIAPVESAPTAIVKGSDGADPEAVPKAVPKAPPANAEDRPSPAAVQQDGARPVVAPGADKVAPQVGVVLGEPVAGLKLVSLAVSHSVEDRNPVGVATRFTEIPPRFHCHSVLDCREEKSVVIHTWRRGERVISRVELEVGKSPAWRTWSRQRIRPQWAGVWSCSVSTEAGALLGTATFEVAPAQAQPDGNGLAPDANTP